MVDLSRLSSMNVSFQNKQSYRKNAFVFHPFISIKKLMSGKFKLTGIWLKIICQQSRIPKILHFEFYYHLQDPIKSKPKTISNTTGFFLPY